MHRRLSLGKMLTHWAITFFGNLAGSLFLVAIIAGCTYNACANLSKTTNSNPDGGIFDSAPYHAEAIAFATKKQITPSWQQIFIRGIGANWLVCLACFLGASGRELVSKIAGIWWPIFAFVSLGLDHVVANMFFVPMGIWQGTPGLTVGLYIWKGIIPAGLGNIVGGAIFCGGFYWYMYLQGAGEIAVDGVFWESTKQGLMGTSKVRDEESAASSGSSADKSGMHVE